MSGPVDTLARRMKRWTDEKLECETAFGPLSDDGSVEGSAWVSAIASEKARRAALDRVGGAA